MPFIPLVGALAVLLALGWLERRARDLAWRSIPVRVHVNGTRGKSTVTRLIWAALREAGIPTVAKTTGTEPRLLLPDGSERAVRRLAPACIREQLQLLRAARRHGARAVVAECMAIDPELQWVSERRMLHASIAVVTNVRPDHVEIMGDTEASIAGCLANTIPPGGVVVAGGPATARLLADRVRALGARLVTAGAGPEEGWLAENRQTALAVTRELGVPDDVAARGFAAVPHDPGAVRSGRLWEGSPARWIDATAANDPVSLDRLLGEAALDGAVTVVYNHRDDRGPRLRTFLGHRGIVAQADRLVITGARPALTLWRQARRQRATLETRFVPPHRLAGWLARHGGATHLVFSGNTRGLDVSRLLAEAGRRG